MNEPNFDADRLSLEELVKIMHREIKELKTDFKNIVKILENPPENKELRKEVDKLKMDFAVAESKNKSEKESDKKWQYLIIFIIGIINFLIAMMDKF